MNSTINFRRWVITRISQERRDSHQPTHLIRRSINTSNPNPGCSSGLAKIWADDRRKDSKDATNDCKSKTTHGANLDQQTKRTQSNQSTTQPWFIEDDNEPNLRQDDQQQIAKEEQPTTQSTHLSSPPANLPSDLIELHQYLLTSPYFDPASILFIDAKLEQGDAAWTDWVVLLTLKSGRESAIRGAADAVKSILEKRMKVRVEGINNSIRTSSSENNHHQSAPSWVLVDAGKAVVHILNSSSRQLYALENVAKNYVFQSSSSSKPFFID